MRTKIEEFIADLLVEGRRPLTIASHQRHLDRLAEWFEGEGVDWATCDRKTLQRYVRRWGGAAPSTRANLFTTLRRFYGWAVEQGYVALSPAAALKTPKRARPLPRALTADQVRRLLEHLADVGTRRARRDRALILTALYSGLRACELAALRWSSVDFAGEVINIRLSKMNHGRAVPLHPQLRAELEIWSSHQAVTGDDPPVFSLGDEPIVPDRAGKICRGHSKRLRIHFCTHALRHTFATMLLRKSGNLYAVSKALGHLDLKQTEVYLSATVEDMREALEKLPGVDSW